MTERFCTIQNPFFIILLIIVLLCAGIIAFFMLTGLQNHGSQYCRLDNSGKLLDPCIPRFRILNGTNDTIDYEGSLSGSPAPPVEECSYYAEIALVPFGGLPKDAVLTGIENGVRGSKYNPTTKKSTPPVIETRRMNFRQVLYGMPVLGKGGRMTFDIGVNGSIYELSKRWLSLEETGLTRIIPQSEAIQRLRNGLTRTPNDLILNLTIRNMTLGYYIPTNRTESLYLEPVWILDATDEIRGRSLQFYIPAEADIQGWNTMKVVSVSQDINYTRIRNDSIQPDIVYPVNNIWIGGFGPVGKEKALNAVSTFTKKTDVNLTYEGRFTEQGGGGCGGRSYFWDYYEFSTPDCDVKVDAYTGTILNAALNATCSNAGIGSFALAEKTPPSESTRLAVTNFTREQYYHFDQRHMELDLTAANYNANNFFKFRGDRSIDSDFGVFLIYQPKNGLLVSYSVTDDVLQYACSGGGTVKIPKE